MHQSAERPAFCSRMLHIIVQVAETRVSPLFSSGFSRNLVRLKDSICNPYIAPLGYTVAMEGSHTPSRWTLVDAAMACGVFLHSLGLSELGLINWVVFLAFYNNYANCEISRFFRTTLYSLIMLPIHISTNIFSSQWS